MGLPEVERVIHSLKEVYALKTWYKNVPGLQGVASDSQQHSGSPPHLPKEARVQERRDLGGEVELSESFDYAVCKMSAFSARCFQHPVLRNESEI